MGPLSGLPRRIRASTVGTHLWALLDQSVVSLGSVLTSILLARYLTSDTFGMAVLLIAGMLFLNTIHASLIVYPLSVHGARLRGVNSRDYAGVALSATLTLAVPFAFVLAVAVVFVSGRAMWVAALALLRVAGAGDDATGAFCPASPPCGAGWGHSQLPGTGSGYLHAGDGGSAHVVARLHGHDADFDGRDRRASVSAGADISSPTFRPSTRNRPAPIWTTGARIEPTRCRYHAGPSLDAWAPRGS